MKKKDKEKTEEIVRISLVDGEEISLTKEEFEKIGREGAIKKYASCRVGGVQKRMKSQKQ